MDSQCTFLGNSGIRSSLTFCSSMRVFILGETTWKGLTGSILLSLTTEAPGDYRPISLINFSSKILSKLMATGLSKVMNSLIETDQSIFLKKKIHLG